MISATPAPLQPAQEDAEAFAPRVGKLDQTKPDGFLAGKSTTTIANHAHVLNPIAQRVAVVGVDRAIGELVEALTTDERLALGKIASIMRSNEPHDLLPAFISAGLGDTGLQLVTAVLAQELGWKGEIIQ